MTGASVGMGRATALPLAARGDRAAVARGGAGLTGAADEARHTGGEELILPVDVADPKAMDRAAQQVVDAFGRIDVWVSNAFAGVVAPFMQATPDACRRATEVTGLCCVFGTRAALSHMLLNNPGTNAQVEPALTYRGVPLASAYCGAKHAIQGCNASLRGELLHEGTRARTTMVQVPAVNTPHFARVLSHVPGRARPGAPVHEPDLAGRAMDHTAAHARRLEILDRRVTVAPPVANAVVPGLLDRYLAYGDDAQLDEAEHAGAGNLWSPRDGPLGWDFWTHGRFDVDPLPVGAQGMDVPQPSMGRQGRLHCLWDSPLRTQAVPQRGRLQLGPSRGVWPLRAGGRGKPV
ncbi:SDR family oxidoreductase [Streptomyces sp. NPDC059262]|uniref:SDR family oxidoreductase n=1 Tax=Streptomyces sp. NPDC059262 TaxID=3346797 RepID=UPI00369CE8D2